MLDHEPRRADDGGLGRGLDRLVLAQERDHGHRGGVSLADLGQLVDPGVAARPLLVPRTDLVEELVGDLLAGQDRQAAPEMVRGSSRPWPG